MVIENKERLARFTFFRYFHSQHQKWATSTILPTKNMNPSNRNLQVVERIEAICLCILVICVVINIYNMQTARL